MIDMQPIIILPKEGLGMSVLRSADALDILSGAYSGSDGRKTVPKRWDLREEQLDMIKLISERYNESQVTILRSIIDEWREMKLREAAEA